jgi:c-di-GMP-binding flagellar brake protein YcgR
MEERRKHIRLKAFLAGEIQPEKETGLPSRMQLVDFSRQGLKIFTPQVDFPKTGLVKLRVYPADSKVPISLCGAIRWVQPKQEGCEIGAEIAEMDSDDKNKILDYAYNLWKEEKTGIR